MKNRKEVLTNPALVLFLLGTALLICGLNASGATLLPSRDNVTGRRVYTDRWGSTDVRDMNTEFQINLLGSTLALGVMGTNLDVKLMLVIISYGTNDYPRRFSGGISVQVRTSTNESNLKNLLGQFNSAVVLHPVGRTNALVEATLHGREALEDQRTLFLYELDFSIPLDKKLSEVPEYISILSSMYGELDFWRYRRIAGERPGRSSDETIPVPQGSTKLTSASPKPEGIQRAEPTPRTATRTFPEISLSVTREKDYLLITCSLLAENAELEEVDLTFSPLAWRPLKSGTNQGSRWYVPSADGARAFRVRIAK